MGEIRNEPGTTDVVVLDPQAEEAWTTEEDDIEDDRRIDTEADIADMLWPLVKLAMDSAENLPTSPEMRLRAFAGAAGILTCYLAFREEDRAGQGDREWDEEVFVEAFAKGWDCCSDDPDELALEHQPKRWQQAHLPQAVVQRAVAGLLDPRAILERFGVEAKVLDSLEDLARSRDEELTDVVARLLNDTVTWRRGDIH